MRLQMVALDCGFAAELFRLCEPRASLRPKLSGAESEESTDPTAIGRRSPRSSQLQPAFSCLIHLN